MKSKLLIVTGLLLLTLGLFVGVAGAQDDAAIQGGLLYDKWWAVTGADEPTAHARQSLARGYSMEQWLEQQGYLAGFIAACASNDSDLLGRTLRDVLIEPQRAAAVPCFEAVKEAAMRGGAFGASLSGSGPSIFALCNDAAARNIASAMEQACRSLGIDCQTWVSPMDAKGARLED